MSQQHTANNWIFCRRPFMGNRFVARLRNDPRICLQDERTKDDALFDTLAEAKSAVRAFMQAKTKGLTCAS